MERLKMEEIYIYYRYIQHVLPSLEGLYKACNFLWLQTYLFLVFWSNLALSKFWAADPWPSVNKLETN